MKQYSRQRRDSTDRKSPMGLRSCQSLCPLFLVRIFRNIRKILNLSRIRDTRLSMHLSLNLYQNLVCPILTQSFEEYIVRNFEPASGQLSMWGVYRLDACSPSCLLLQLTSETTAPWMKTQFYSGIAHNLERWKWGGHWICISHWSVEHVVQKPWK